MKPDNIHKRPQAVEVMVHILAWGIVFAFPIAMMSRGGLSVEWHDYMRSLLMVLAYAIVFYVNYFIFVPRFLSQGRIKKMLAGNVALIVAMVLALHFGMEFLSHTLLPDRPPHPMGPPKTIFMLRDIGSMILTAGLSAAIKMSRRWTQLEAARREAEQRRTEAELKEVVYNGRTYRQRPGLETYLVMGVDTSGAGLGVNSYAGGGQADVQMVVVLDNINQTWQMLQLNRDSIVQVPVRGVHGDIVAYDNEQLALAYYYGDGREQSCENTVLTVSTLLNGQTIDGYVAVNMDAVGIITDMVGGVTLTVTSDFSAIDPSLVEGETVTLYGDQALTYVRSRYNIDDETNLARMARQRQYLVALEEKLRQQDGEFVASAYQELSDDMVTNIGSGTAVDIADRLQEYTELPLLTIDGENVVEGEHWAYHLDEDSLQQTILQLFYQEQ